MHGCWNGLPPQEARDADNWTRSVFLFVLFVLFVAIPSLSRFEEGLAASNLDDLLLIGFMSGSERVVPVHLQSFKKGLNEGFRAVWCVCGPVR